MHQSGNQRRTERKECLKRLNKGYHCIVGDISVDRLSGDRLQPQEKEVGQVGPGQDWVGSLHQGGQDLGPAVRQQCPAAQEDPHPGGTAPGNARSGNSSAQRC